MSQMYEEWKSKQAVLKKMKTGKKYSCQDCHQILNDNAEMENHMKQTDFDHCLFDEV